MTKTTYSAMLLFLFALEILRAQEICAGSAAELAGKARKFVEMLSQGRSEEAARNFDAAMKEALPPAKLAHIWNVLERQVGQFEAPSGYRVERETGYTVVLVTCKFEKLDLDARVVFDSSHKIAGLLFTPSTYQYNPPPYVDRESFEETSAKIGRVPWELPGVLSLPKGIGPFPAVVLVHGADPKDLDESVGPNKPFRDIAWGLASRGIAVLRYANRAHAHPRETAAVGERLTIYDIAIDDALSAVALLEEHKRIAADRIFVLGQGVGGMVAPKIASMNAKIRGIAVMAGPTRPLEDLLEEQLSRLVSLDGEISEADRKAMDALREKVRRAKSPELGVRTPSADLPLEIPASVWLSLRGYSPAETSKKIGCPILVLQGERDWQVSMENFRGWRRALAERPKTSFQSYPALDHWMMPGEGPLDPEEYLRENHVAFDVIEDVARWIRQNWE